MSQLIFELPETLHHQLETLARSEGVSLSQYILFALTRQAMLAYTVRAVSETEIAQQRTAFSALLQSLGRASFAEIEQTLQERETVTPETGLTPEIMQRLQNRMRNNNREHEKLPLSCKPYHFASAALQRKDELFG
jgi:hypothetical protein